VIRFIDGPAQGVTLLLRAAPEVLRVVRAEDGTWDALDQPGDEPRAGEEVFVYRREGRAGVAMLDFARGSKYRSGAYAAGRYRHEQNPG
jgi:hypothetical protein